jgi:hypothetical protein
LLGFFGSEFLKVVLPYENEVNFVPIPMKDDFELLVMEENQSTLLSGKDVDICVRFAKVCSFFNLVYYYFLNKADKTICQFPFLLGNYNQNSVKSKTIHAKQN